MKWPLPLLRNVALLAALVCAGLSVALAALPGTGLAGVVKSSDGKPLEGVAVSARAQGSTISTSVYTNQSGEYYFPPLPAGQYRMSAQAVGFELARAEQTVPADNKKSRQDFALKPFADTWKQLSDAEWFASLPDDTAQDRKMKRVLLYNCGTCHNSAFVLEKRFSKADWALLIDRMSRISGSYDPPGGSDCCGGVSYPGGDQIPGGGKFATPMFDEENKPIGAERRILEFYKNDIIDYLSRVRGPDSPPPTPKPFPRATGASAAIVVTEYDIPSKDGRTLGRLDPKSGLTTQFRLSADGSTVRNDKPYYHNNEFRDGSDWSRGQRVSYQEEGQHDLILGRDGYVYLSPSIGVGIDPQGNIWFGNEMGVKFDVKAEKLTPFPLPKGWPIFYNGKDIDSKGNFWAAELNGAYRLNPKTGGIHRIQVAQPAGQALWPHG